MLTVMKGIIRGYFLLFTPILVLVLVGGYLLGDALIERELYRVRSDESIFLSLASGRLDDELAVPLRHVRSMSEEPILLEAAGRNERDNIAAQFWSIGHRNTYGMAFDKQGTFWQHEMGPKGGDELNIIEKGQNYGWPIVSNGDNYDGSVIPDHNTRPEFTAPKVSWTPVISPSALAIYDKGAQHNDFPQWQDRPDLPACPASGTRAWHRQETAPPFLTMHSWWGGPCAKSICTGASRPPWRFRGYFCPPAR